MDRYSILLKKSPCEKGHNWKSAGGGRPCPKGIWNCSQTVYQCKRCGNTDYGEKGGPAWVDCFQNCDKIAKTHDINELNACISKNKGYHGTDVLTKIEKNIIEEAIGAIKLNPKKQRLIDEAFSPFLKNSKGRKKLKINRLKNKNEPV